MRRGSTFWGLVFILVGTLLLLNSLGILPGNIWNFIWPGFLILLGVWVLLGAFMRPSAANAEQVAIPLDGARQARVRVHHGAGNLYIKSGTPPDKLVDGTFGGGLDFRKRQNGDTLEVDMHMPSDAWTNFWGPWTWGSRGALDWAFALNSDVPLALDLETGASNNELDLSNLRVNELSLKTGASSTVMTLPTHAGQTRVRVEAGAASVKVRVPNGVACRVRVRGGLAGIDVDTRRFPKTGGDYQSADYATAANKVDLDAELGAGSIEVR